MRAKWSVVLGTAVALALSTYERPPLRARPGDEVGARPLCLACHVLD
jgi:hypothetical protein